MAETCSESVEVDQCDSPEYEICEFSVPAEHAGKALSDLPYLECVHEGCLNRSRRGTARDAVDSRAGVSRTAADSEARPVVEVEDLE